MNKQLLMLFLHFMNIFFKLETLQGGLRLFFFYVLWNLLKLHCVVTPASFSCESETSGGKISNRFNQKSLTISSVMKWSVSESWRKEQQWNLLAKGCSSFLVGLTPLTPPTWSLIPESGGRADGQVSGFSAGSGGGDVRPQVGCFRRCVLTQVKFPVWDQKKEEEEMNKHLEKMRQRVKYSCF